MIVQKERYNKLLSLLSQDKFIKANILAEKMCLHIKTLRHTIRQLNDYLSAYDAYIETKRNKGYLLKVNNFEQFKNLFVNQKTEIPNSSSERVQYLLDYFLNHDEYIKTDELCDMLYISKRTLATDIKNVEQIFNKYNLSLERKPYYGMKIIGNEFHIRQCIAKIRETKQEQNYFIDSKNLQEIENLSTFLSKFLQKENFQISDINLQNLVIHIYVAIKRIKNQQYVPLPENNYHKYINDTEYARACRLAEKLKNHFNVNFPEGEIIYIAIHFAGKRSNNLCSSANNLIISSQIIEIVQLMLEEIYRSFQIDLRSDLELLMTLGQHLGPLEVRLQYDMNLKNPLLDEIKKRYCLAYVMASQAGSVLTRHYKKMISSDEIGYIALTLELALERQRLKKDKKNVLVVCSSGAGTAKLLAFKMQNTFNDCIGKVTTCDEHSILYQDFSQIDYVFTTVPIQEQIPVPITEMKMFLGEKDISMIRKVLHGNNNKDISKYYPQDLFFTHISFATKEAVLKFMCDKMNKLGYVNKDFYSAVIKREQMGYTCMENLAAMPHPYKMLSDETFVSICILDKPIKWNDEYFVQIIFLISGSKRKDENLQNFYMTIAKLILNSDAMKELINNKKYETLKKLLATI